MNDTALQVRAPEEMMVAEPSRSGNWSVPPVDISEDFEAIQVIASLPGVLHEDIQVTFEKDILKIRARVRETCPNARYLLREFDTAGYERTFRISERIDHEQITADYANGVLTLSLPKSDSAKPRSIPVNVDAS